MSQSKSSNKAGRPEKPLESYLVDPPGKATSIDDYLAFPARAFLMQICEMHDAFNHCLNKFTKKGDGEFNKDSADSLHQVAVSLMATAMGHFETYEKCLFAGVFERTRYFPAFDAETVAKKLENPAIDIARFSAYRGLKAPVGLTVADSLAAWHSPKKVNAYFSALGVRNTFSNAHITQLEVLWQLRHSIVHSGAFLTLPDSQKVRALRGAGDRSIGFDQKFINALARRLYRIVRDANERVRTEAELMLGAKSDEAAVSDLRAFLEIKSPKSNWL